MAISTDAAVEFYGTQANVITTTGTVADAAFSSDVTTFTNSDDAPSAGAVLSCTFSVAPDANSSVALFARLLNVVTTTDQDVPTANFQHTYVGSFPVKNVTSAQVSALAITLPSVKSGQELDFYIQNNAGQTISTGATVDITPKTIGPKA